MARPFRPTAISTVAVLIVVAVTWSASRWQLRRYGEAEAAMAAVEGRVHAPPLGADDLARPVDALDWRQIRLSGRYTDDGPFVVAGGIDLGQRGYTLVDVLQVDGGPKVLVQRGWVPVEARAAVVAASRIDGPVEVQGLLRPVSGPDDLRPVPGPDGAALWPLVRETFLGVLTRGRLIPWASLAAVVPGGVAPVVVLEGPELDDPEARDLSSLPAPGFSYRRKTWHHLDYAFQWFAFGAIAIGLWAWRGLVRGRALTDAA